MARALARPAARARPAGALFQLLEGSPRAGPCAAARRWSTSGCPVRVLNFAWHRLERPPVERFAGAVDVAHSSHPLLMPARNAARLVTIYDLFFLADAAGTATEIRRDYPALTAAHARRADAVVVISRYTASAVAAQLDVPADRLVLCPPGAPDWPRRDRPGNQPAQSCISEAPNGGRTYPACCARMRACGHCARRAPADSRRPSPGSRLRDRGDAAGAGSGRARRASRLRRRSGAPASLRRRLDARGPVARRRLRDARPRGDDRWAFRSSLPTAARCRRSPATLPGSSIQRTMRRSLRACGWS